MILIMWFASHINCLNNFIKVCNLYMIYVKLPYISSVEMCEDWSD